MKFEDMTDEELDNFGVWYRAGLFVSEIDEATSSWVFVPSEKLLSYLGDGTMKAVCLTQREIPLQLQKGAL